MGLGCRKTALMHRTVCLASSGAPFCASWVRMGCRHLEGRAGGGGGGVRGERVREGGGEGEGGEGERRGREGGREGGREEGEGGREGGGGGRKGGGGEGGEGERTYKHACKCWFIHG